MTDSATSTPRETSHGKPGGLPLHTQIFIGLLIGATLGLVANFALSRLDKDASLHRLLETSIAVAEPLGKVFLRLVLMVVLPLVFSALALGVLELGDLRKVGRVGLRTLFFTAILSLTAVGIGVGLVGTIKPGARLPVGVQVIAPAWREDLALRIAHALEEEGVAAAPVSARLGR